VHYIWFVWTLIGLVLWIIIYVWQRRLRRQMLWASVWTAPLGLTERLFVPEYWTPPSLFDLAEKTGFDIESVIFSFVIGGVASILYEIVFRASLVPMSMSEHRKKRHRFHRLALLSPVLFFTLFMLIMHWNPIYCFVGASVLGSIAAIICRPDLTRKILAGGVLFTGLYFVFFISLVIAAPSYVQAAWNLSALSGILFMGIPLEEYLFAFGFGMLWSSLYEHIQWYRVSNSVK
jgi:hypothetical protein